MRIAFCGKGDEVLAIDGDINQHLTQALSLDVQRLKKAA